MNEFDTKFAKSDRYFEKKKLLQLHLHQWRESRWSRFRKAPRNGRHQPRFPQRVLVLPKHKFKILIFNFCGEKNKFELEFEGQTYENVKIFNFDGLFGFQTDAHAVG